MMTPNSLGKASSCDGEPAPEGRASLALAGRATQAEFEVAMRRGLVAVHRDECGRVDIVRDCQVESSASYRYESHDPQQSSEEERGRGLHVTSVTGGSYRADTASLGAPKLVGAGCSKATHIVTAVSVGAFAVSRGRGNGVSLSGVGASSANDNDVVSREGNPEACKERRDEPARECSAPVDVELTPIKHGPKDAAGVPGAGKQGIETGIIAPQ